MSSIDEILVIIALVLGILDFIHLTGPFSRVSAAGLAVILLAIVMLHVGHVISY